MSASTAGAWCGDHLALSTSGSLGRTPRAFNVIWLDSLNISLERPGGGAGM
jgi:hypothetical protein